MNIDWTAIATLALAVVTAVLVVETWWARKAAERSLVARALRAVVFEQLENLRQWQRCDVDRYREVALARFRETTVSFDHVTELLDLVDLPDELAVYVVWLVGDTTRCLREMEGYVDLAAPPGARAPEVHYGNTPLAGDWQITHEHLQVLLCLVQAEARRRRMAAVAAIGASSIWVRPRSRPGDMRAGDRIVEESHRQAPPFPCDRAYDGCDIGPREALAARDAEEQRQALIRSQKGVIGPGL